MNVLSYCTVSRLGRAALLVSAVAAGGLSTAHALPAAPQVDKLAVKAGKVITLDGATIEDGVVVIEGGRIIAVGKSAEVEVPWDARVIDHPELIAFPGFVEAHSTSGMDRANEGLDVAPFLDVRDSLDPVNFYFEESLRNGILTINVQQGNETVIAGQGLVVRPHGMTVEEMLVKPNSGLKLSAEPKNGKSRATQAQTLRAAFAGLRAYLEEMVQRKKDGNDFDRRQALYQGRTLEGDAAKGKAMQGDGWKVEGFELVPRGEVDQKQEPLLRVVEGRLPVWFYCGSAADVHTALDIAKENGFLKTTTLVLGPACWKAASKIAEAKVPVVLSANLVHMERDPVTNEEIETFVPKVYADHGIEFALTSTGDANRSLWYQAAQCVANGISRDAALAAVTTKAAAMLGLGDRVGKLAPGFDGNLVLLSGDPLGVTTRVEYVVLRGVQVYDRSQDVRAKFLLEGKQPAGTASDGTQPEDLHEEEVRAAEKAAREQAGNSGGSNQKDGGR